MFLWQIVFLLVALLCTVGRCQETEDDKLKAEYLEKCKAGRSNVKKMEVYMYQEFSCAYWCSGEDENGQLIFEVKRKEDRLKCTDILSLKKEPMQCLNGSCVTTADVELCRDRVPGNGNLQHLDSDGCTVYCSGNSKVVIDKPVGNPCQIRGDFYKPAKCNGLGRCAEIRTYVSETSGEANANTAKAICEERHSDADSIFSFQALYGDDCEFGCYTSENDGKSIKLEYLTFEDGTSCGDGGQCLGGRCRKQPEIQACQAKLKEDLIEMKLSECTQQCFGKSSEAFYKMPANSNCTVMVDGWNQKQGVCNAGSKCVLKN